MRVIKGFFLLIVGTLLLISSVFLIAVLAQYATDPLRKLNGLVAHDYLPTVQTLEDEGRTALALQLTEFLAANPAFPNQEGITAKRKQLSAQRSPLQRIKQGVVGFLRGGGKNQDDLWGAMASDLLLGEDAREIINRLAARIGVDTRDPLSNMLFQIEGLASGSDSVAWSVSLLRVLSRSDALSPELAGWISEEGRRSAGQRELTAPLRLFLVDTERLAHALGLPATRALFKEFQSPDAVHALLPLAKKERNAAFLTVHNGGLPLLTAWGKERVTESASLFELAAVKGPDGVAVLAQKRFELSALLRPASPKGAQAVDTLIVKMQKNSATLALFSGAAFLSFVGSLLCYRGIFAKRKHSQPALPPETE